MEKQRQRFSISDDITLLRQVLKENPFEDSVKWKDIQDVVNLITGKEFSLRCVREHLNHIMSVFVKEGPEKLRRPGKEFEFAEREKLLQEAITLSAEWKYKYKKIKTSDGYTTFSPIVDVDKTHKETSSSEQIIRDLAAIKTEFVIDDNESIFNSKQDANDNSIQEEIEQSDSNYASPTHFLATKKRRPARKLAITTIKNLSEKEIELKRKEIDLEEKRLRLEETKLEIEREKLELQKKEQEVKLELETEERRHRMKMAEVQQTMLLSLLENIMKMKNIKD